MQLDDILLKDIDELSSEEKDFLKEHKDDLEDSEKEAYKTVFEDKKEEKEEEKGFSFKNKEELDSYLEKFVSAKLPEKEDEKIDKKEDDIPDFFDKDYKPADWNDAFKSFLKNPKFVEYITKRPEVKETVKEEIVSVKQTEEEQRKKINEDIDNEMKELRDKYKDIPATGTDENKEWEKQLAQTFIDFPSLRTMEEAYRIMQLKGTIEKVKEEEQEDLASKIGGGKGTGGGSGGKKYSEIAGRDMDAAYEAALRKLGE